MSDPRRSIPSMDVLLAAPAVLRLLGEYPRSRVVEALRTAIDEVRNELTDSESAEARSRGGGELTDPAIYADRATERLRAADVPSLRRVINATGVVLHTNLGRAPLAPSVRAAMTRAAEGYSNLEFDLPAGARGSRYDHCRDLLRETTGAQDALVVNNNAAALVLMLSAAARGRGVAVSRGELVEIGGGFRIPEILERSGATLVEVGSTNRTRVADYETAVDEHDVAVILKVHRSNFRMSGFTEEVGLHDLAELGARRGAAVFHDLGSGLFVDAATLGLPDEPLAAESLSAGADAVAVSGDKLFGGPQAGMIVGASEWIDRFRRDPLCRALRVDKVTLAGLEATLRLYRDPDGARREIPTLRMLAESSADLEAKARRLADRLRDAGATVSVAPTRGAVGGGTYPDVELDSWAVVLPADRGAHEVAALLRSGQPPVVGRISDDRLQLDMRTVQPSEEDELIAAVVAALAIGAA